ncbi:MAG TPA: tRNA threonylcarbamoyladenosine dehydratase [Candidatus Eisenbergiella pullistercoris]|uniref:tRNA threonylcarbamoyladenosine dehydratase n=1 Tax=Candidatus Eisenbergiella pullistercoris TaxID=2838555 RepID=A0A9D1YRP3_9FIRM|nr:tRNA threonylcarbamoyladenosine dehydratase [Candidatus Eisenbergiella pullistercoris]
MKEQFTRTAMLLGEDGVERLERARVAVFGIGGVGGYVAEALARSGVGHFLLVDSDRVALSNLNRQIIATLETVGQYKTQAMKERILSINPDAQVETRECFFLPENAEEFDFTGLDYVVDAVDTVTAKLELILRARRFGVPVISSMGAGNKLDASRLEVADIYQTSVCPLARVMRRELKARGVDRLKVVYSREEARKPAAPAPQASDGDSRPVSGAAALSAGGSFPVSGAAALSAGGSFPASGAAAPSGGEAGASGPEREAPAPGRRAVPGSVVFVPAAAGLILAGEVVKDLCGI